MPLRRALPVLPIPLRRQEPAIALDLQALLERSYASGRYDTMDCRTVLEPPLPPEEAAWANELLQAAEKTLKDH
jgi:hypothetical protein